jgi:hypothetical protein
LSEESVEAEMSGVHRIYWRDDKCIQKSWSENLKRRDNLMDLDINKKVILRWFLSKQDRKVWTN